jgi:hypothetical protein
VVRLRRVRGLGEKSGARDEKGANHPSSRAPT